MVRPSTPPPQATSQAVNVSPPTPEVTRKLVRLHTSTTLPLLLSSALTPNQNRKNPASAQKTSAHNEKPPPAHPEPSGPSPSRPRALSTPRTSTSSPRASDHSASGPTSPSHNHTSQRPTAMRVHQRRGKMSASPAAAAGAMGRAPCRARPTRSLRGSWITTLAT